MSDDEADEPLGGVTSLPTTTTSATTEMAWITMCGARSGVSGCFLRELHAGGDAEFGVDVGEVGLHGAW